MFCTNCGNQIPDGSTMCPVCGNLFNIELETQGMANQNQTINNQGNSVNMAQQFQTIGQNKLVKAKPNKANEERQIKNVEELFVDEDEKQVAVLGGNYLQNMLRGGGLSKGFGVLTDKRYYFKGKCYTKQAGHFVNTDEEWCVDVKDITATGFAYKRRIGLLLLAIACLVIGVYCLASEVEAKLFFVALLLGGVLFLIEYFISKRGMYIVAFAGGSIGLDVSSYGGTKAVKAFDRKIRKVKDKVTE